VLVLLFAGSCLFCSQLLAVNPLVRAQPIIFVVRPQYQEDHHNTATMFVTGEINTRSFRAGGIIKAIDFAKGQTVRTIFDAGENGGIRDIDVSYDGRRILFSMRKSIEEDYHIYEIDADGTGLRQLTSMTGVADIDPVYLPDGSIVFSSTRELKYCGCNRHIMGNLFKMGADGANIHQIAKSTLHEGHASVMSDGRILYDRWEYVDRNFGDAQGLWTVNPDGTNQSVYWGNNTSSPGGAIDARQIPQTQRVVCTFTSCHDRPWGAIAIIDSRMGIDGRIGVVRTWPETAIDLVENGDLDTFKQVNPKYEDPFPLSDEYFLCSRMTGDGEKMGIYLLDVFGNETLLHTEGEGCFDPMPLAAKPRPAILPIRRDFKNANASFYVVDVYQGTHMKGVERPAVKYLRIIESPEKRFWTIPQWDGQGQQAPGMNWHNFENKRILATVPVEQDGSAYFQVPSDTFIYFQLLDENGMMIQSMRSGTVAQSGEITGCMGCHDNRRAAPPAASDRTPLAMQRPPSKLNGWYGPPRLFSYMKEVQPVFDRHCVSCHDFGKEAGKKLILAGDRDNTFNASYVDLWMKKYINCVGAGSHLTMQAHSWGAHESRLVQQIMSGHSKVKLSSEELDRIITWIDLNGPYYPSYASAYPDNLAGRSPLSDAQIRELEELTAVNLTGLEHHARQLSSQISFDRPQLSPCLESIKDDPKKMAKAIEIIEAGKKSLAENPRGDMEGFTPCPIDQNRQGRYSLQRENELLIRAAIRNGDKIYDNH